MADRLRQFTFLSGLPVVIVASVLAACVFAEGAPGSSPNEFNPLLDDARTHLSICVDGAGGVALSNEDAQTVREALESGLAEIDDVPPDYAKREVVVGCPPPAEWLGAPQEERFVHVPEVDTASEHRLHVYFLPPDLYNATFPAGKPYARTAEELVVEGEEAWPVTEGLYFPLPASPDAIREGLLVQLQLIDQPGTPQPTIDWCACDRGQDPDPPYWTCDNPYTEEQCEDQKQDQSGQ
jgi:hypothetical protein